MGIAGGNGTIGTIVADASDAQVGIYTAPRTVPTTNNGQVDITAVAPQDPTATTTATGPTVTSNMAVVPNHGDGKTDAYASGTTQLILDISAYFAP